MKQWIRKYAPGWKTVLISLMLGNVLGEAYLTIKFPPVDPWLVAAMISNAICVGFMIGTELMGWLMRRRMALNEETILRAARDDREMLRYGPNG